jgi:hypothetical protein
VVGQARRLERGVNFQLNATGSQVDQSCSGFAGGDPVADLESPLPDFRFAGGCDAVLEHDLSRVGPAEKERLFCPRYQSV